MNLNKTSGNLLLDFYGNLLTDRQNEVMNLYFSDDYSMGEIADDLNISKSAVSDIIHRSSNQLKEYEEKLKLLASFKKRNEIYEEMLKTNDETVIKYVRKLMNIERED